jgi:hypothetical protein
MLTRILGFKGGSGAAAHAALNSGAPLALLVNNVGGTSNLELAAVVNEALLDSRQCFPSLLAALGGSDFTHCLLQLIAEEPGGGGGGGGGSSTGSGGGHGGAEITSSLHQRSLLRGRAVMLLSAIAAREMVAKSP